ncbi:DNA replication protein [Paramagnetospirillum kuznetsovii]|uniref:DNA replication protein n=1 Tax=Paramagnetospirillum kuznetsovii TaxID=2053833 RepID=A0A364NVD2_9PROT|nr:DNA replication protein [Paramagnetospirillum kuznetsovii]RAU21044.1 DNA replication protein [Paramagnetospirillum kuznetsovii]
MSQTQIPLDLGHRPALSEADFLVAPCNAEAHAWLCRWPDWPNPASVIHGPAGSGKTHLAHLFAARLFAIGAKARIIEAAALDMAAPPLLLDGVKAVVVEDCDRGKLDETALFHLINLVKESGANLLLSGREPASRWPVKLPDLRSRLNAMPSLAIGAPDDELLAAVLVKQFTDRQVRIGEGLVPYLLGRMERSFEACARLVERLDRAALAERRAVTVPLARRVLEQEDQDGSGHQGS